MPYQGYYLDGEKKIGCMIIRMGAQNSRIQLEDGTETLKPSHLVKRTGLAGPAESIDNSHRNLTELILPRTPLEIFYRQLRKATGNKQKKFEEIQSRLCDRHGAKGASFLGELFRRSVTHASFYRNVNEGFCPNREASKGSDNYARKLVQHLDVGSPVEVGEFSFTLVDSEIFPFRTKTSCTERGRPAKSTGSGGMDMLLAAKTEDTVPAVGEIKADSENVGPTFALIQSLMYASQIATANQFERLAKCYEKAFGNLSKDNPTVEIIIILESVDKCIAEDLDYAIELASSMLNSDATAQIGAVRFMQCSADGFQWNDLHCALPTKP